MKLRFLGNEKHKKYLSEIGIEFKEFSHPEIYTCEDAEKYTSGIRGRHLKNLLIKDRGSKRFYLVILPADEKLDMGFLGATLLEKIKFANEDNLKELLGTKPGSVSPFGLINDIEHRVKVVIGKDIWDSDFLSFHPNINTETLELAGKDFQKYIESLGNELILI